MLTGWAAASSAAFVSQACSSGGLAPVDHLGDPQVFFRLEPDTIRHPAFLSQRKRYFGRVRSWGRVDT